MKWIIFAPALLIAAVMAAGQTPPSEAFRVLPAAPADAPTITPYLKYQTVRIADDGKAQPQRKRFSTSQLVVPVVNRGVAGVPGMLWLTLKGPETSWKMRGALDPGQPSGGGNRECSFVLPKGFVGNVQLATEIELRPGVFKPVAWACEQPLNADGSITVLVKDVNDPTWRKGV